MLIITKFSQWCCAWTAIVLLIGCGPEAVDRVEDKVAEVGGEVENPAGPNSQLPHLFTDARGDVYLSWVESDEDGMHFLNYARFREGKWSKKHMIAHGDDWFVNWADYPGLVVDAAGNMAAWYLQKRDTGTYDYDIRLILSEGGGIWSEPLTPHRDSVAAEHGFVSVVPHHSKTGHFVAVWLDGRMSQGHGAGGAMTLRMAQVDMQGRLSTEGMLDRRVCDCCQTTAVPTKAGFWYAYRDRGETEIRDISWGYRASPVNVGPRSLHPDGWEINGCPVNGPRADADGSRLAVAWFTAANDHNQVLLKLSEDDGRTFSEVIAVDTGEALGRVDVVCLAKGRTAVSWLKLREAEAEIWWALVDKEGKIESRTQLVKTSPERASGFPQLSRYGDNLLLAWTDAEGPRIRTKVVTMP